VFNPELRPEPRPWDVTPSPQASLPRLHHVRIIGYRAQGVRDTLCSGFCHRATDAIGRGSCRPSVKTTSFYFENFQPLKEMGSS
jgi:hypothetical protein